MEQPTRRTEAINGKTLLQFKTQNEQNFHEKMGGKETVDKPPAFCPRRGH